MSERAPTRLFFPADPRRPFGLDDVVIGLVKSAGFGRGNRVLVLGCGNSFTPIVLAKDLGCKVVAIDTDTASVERLREEAKKEALTSAIDAQNSESDQVNFGKGFHAILIEGRISAPVSDVLEVLKPQLAKNGRVTLNLPVKVGRSIAPAVEAFWQKHSSEPLMSPAEALQALERGGYEPQTMRSLSDSELSDFYSGLERANKKSGKSNEVSAAITEEVAIFRTQSSGSSVTLAMMVGRRREAGEKPPASRTDG